MINQELKPRYNLNQQLWYIQNNELQHLCVTTIAISRHYSEIVYKDLNRGVERKEKDLYSSKKDAIESMIQHYQSLKDALK